MLSLLLSSSCSSSSPSSNSQTPQLTITDIDVVEQDSGKKTVQLVIELNRVASKVVSFNYATLDGVAVAGEDYSQSSGKAQIDSNTLATSIELQILGDITVELDEFFFVSLSAATNATISNDSAKITIRDDDETAAPVLLNRPTNENCSIPDPPSVSSGLKLTRVFSNLSFNAPVLMLQAPANDTRWYVVEQDGLIKTFETGDSDFTLFADLTDRAVYNGGQDERGLLGMAFHPDFQTNKQVFLYYINNNSGLKTIIGRYISPDNGLTLNVPAFSNEDIVFEVSQPANNHNGGNIQFGSDGYLYIGLGDGGGGNDSFQNGLNTLTLLGSMLRIDVDSTPVSGKAYAIPNDNPFVGNAQVLDEIYAYGLRNPWRWSFDRLTGNLMVADVGQTAREEIDIITAGRHYGWGCYEGSLFNSSYAGECAGVINNPPIYEYPRSDGTTVTGGYVYRGGNQRLSGLVGTYLFADFGFGAIWGIDPYANDPSASHQVLIDTSKNISSFAEDNLAELYVLSWSDGEIFRIDTADNSNFPTLLSDTGCVDPANPEIMDSSMIPYRINAAFWSDGAEKDRWFALQDGSSITVEADGDWTFPMGSILVKNFRINTKLVETRFLVHHQDGNWGGYSYEWNEGQTDATLLLNGKTKVIDGQRYVYPSSSQCTACHTSAAGDTLGPETIQMNRKQRYPSNGNAIGNQITSLDNIGWFSASPGAASSLPKLEDPHNTLATTDSRVRAYLHTNCSQCHRPGHIIQNVDMDFRSDTGWNDINICNLAPTAGNLGIQGAQRLLPGDAEGSVIYQRMVRRDSNGMPPLGSTVVDRQGSELLQQWINALQLCP